MFNNTVTLIDKDTASSQVGVTDFSKPGRVVRKNSTGASLITAIQKSSENKGVETDRLLVRAEFTEMVTIGGVPTPVTAQASIVLSRPWAGSFNNAGGMHTLLCRAVTFIEKGDAPAGIGIAASPVETHLTRLLAGEL